MSKISKSVDKFRKDDGEHGICCRLKLGQKPVTA